MAAGRFSEFHAAGPVSPAGWERAEGLPANLLDIWENEGTGAIGDGFVRVVDPAVTGEKLAPVANATGQWVPVMTTALGDVVYIVKGTYVFVTYWRYGYTDLVSADPARFVAEIETMAVLDGILRRQPYPQRAAQVGIPDLDQCYAYVPLLALGGTESPERLDLSDMWIHLQIVRQLAGPPADRWREGAGLDSGSEPDGGAARPAADPELEEYTAEGAGATFRITARPAFESQARAVLGQITQLGANAREGATADMGWGVFGLVGGGTEFRVVAPSYAASDRLQWVSDTTTGLWAMAWQQATCAAAGVPPAECRYHQWMTVDERALGAPPVMMRRRPPTEAGDSGWHLGLPEGADPVSANGLRRVPTYYLITLHRTLTRALTLPVGSAVLADAESIGRVTGPNGTVLITGPY